MVDLVHENLLPTEEARVGLLVMGIRIWLLLVKVVITLTLDRAHLITYLKAHIAHLTKL